MDLNALLRSNEKILCEKSFYFFVRKAWKPAFGVDLIDGIHIAALSYHFQALFEGQMDLLVANIPPGLGKSSIAVLYGAWCWAKQPNQGLWFASFGQELVERDSLLMRGLVTSDWYVGHWGEVYQLLDDQNQKRRYNNTKGGWRLAASVGSKRGFGEHPAQFICMPYHALVTTDRGDMPVGKIVEERIPCKVASFDHRSETVEWESIEAFESNAGDWVREIQCDNGAVLELTDHHPVWIDSIQTYVSACFVAAGDLLRLKCGQRVTVVSNHGRHSKPDRVYNLRVAKNHNYFANGILVHNCDDPVSPQQALSATEARTSIDFWDNVISTRGIIKNVKRGLVMQRLRENDLSGYILENHPEAVHLMMPMEFEPDRKCHTKIAYFDIDDLDENGEPKRKVGWEDPRTEDGQLLCPQVMSREKVDRLKRGLRTAHAIAGQLQQRPTSPDGDMFERAWFEVVDEPPMQGRAIRAWDKASSIDKKADFTAGVCGVDDGEFVYIMDSIVIKKKRAARDTEIVSTSILDASKYPAYEVALEQEGGSAGKDAAEISADEIYKNGVMVKVYKPLGKPKKTGDGSWDTGGWELYIKLLSEGKVKLVRGPWVEKFINEHVDAPFGKHDDQIDAAARVVTELFKRRRKGVITRDLLLFTDDDADALAKDAESQGKSLCNDCGGLGCQGCEFTGHVQRQQQDYMRPLEEDVDDLGVRW